MSDVPTTAPSSGSLDGQKGKREFVQVLRLLEAMPKEVVTYAATKAQFGFSASIGSDL